MRYFVYFSYDGTRYHGWQRQPNGVSVQQTLEEALSTVLQRETEVRGAGRTDAGVHARMMVAHFDVEEEMENTGDVAWRLNRLLPSDIAVERIERVGEEMHARFSARARTYHYYIHTRKDPFKVGRSWLVGFGLDFERMNEAARALLEYEDFTSFSKTHTDVKTNVCHVSEAVWEEVEPGCWRFTITANRFLRNMVRAVVGTLVEVGRGRLTVEGFREVIEQRDRRVAGESVPACGLYLVDVRY